MKHLASSFRVIAYLFFGQQRGVREFIFHFGDVSSHFFRTSLQTQSLEIVY